jgi:hypothetical protein
VLYVASIMPIDIRHFRVDQGGDPELIRESQRRRFADVGIVDEVTYTAVAAVRELDPSSLMVLMCDEKGC